MLTWLYNFLIHVLKMKNLNLLPEVSLWVAVWIWTSVTSLLTAFLISTYCYPQFLVCRRDLAIAQVDFVNLTERSAKLCVPRHFYESFFSRLSKWKTPPDWVALSHGPPKYKDSRKNQCCLMDSLCCLLFTVSLSAFLGLSCIDIRLQLP